MEPCTAAVTSVYFRMHESYIRTGRMPPTSAKGARECISPPRLLRITPPRMRKRTGMMASRSSEEDDLAILEHGRDDGAVRQMTSASDRMVG